MLWADWAVAYSALAVLLVVAAVTDVRQGKIYNVITYPAVAVGLVSHSLFGGPTGGENQLGLTGALIGLAVGFLPMLLAWMAGGVGGGDARLMAAVGALGGWRFAVATMFYGLLAALVMSVIVMVRRRIVKRTLGRVWRFMILAFLPKGAVLPTTADSPKVPLGLAFCIGAAAALVEALCRGTAGRIGWPLSF